MTQDLMAELESELADNPAPPAEGDKLAQMQALAGRVLVIDGQLDELKRRVAEREKVRNEILGRQLPDLMDAAGVDYVGVEGRRFELADYYHAAIKEEHRDAAHDWLETHEAGDLINYSVQVTFPKDSQEQVTTLAQYVRERYQAATVQVVRGVPWKRLTSWLKELYERKRKDEPHLVIPPLDMMGATVGRVVKIAKPRR